MTIETANAATVPGLLNTLTWAWLFTALPTAVCLWFINAPYGRHNPGSWGPQVNARVGWLLMESPSVLIPIGVFIYLRGWESTAITVFFLIWQTHYVHQAWVYPFRLAQTSSPMPIALASFGAIFNFINCGLHGTWLILFHDSIALDWAAPHFLAGICLFIIGMAVNIDSCTRLLRLKKENPGGYTVPQGGLFRWVSCPHYLGEIIEWFGWALLTWSLPGLTFAVWTLANLGPRARAHHHWYHKQFSDYPAKRKALIPGLF